MEELINGAKDIVRQTRKLQVQLAPYGSMLVTLAYVVFGKITHSHIGSGSRTQLDCR
jgi:hypothetical protein